MTPPSTPSKTYSTPWSATPLSGRPCAATPSPTSSSRCPFGGENRGGRQHPQGQSHHPHDNCEQNRRRRQHAERLGLRVPRRPSRQPVPAPSAGRRRHRVLLPTQPGRPRNPTGRRRNTGQHQRRRDRRARRDRPHPNGRRPHRLHPRRDLHNHPAARRRPRRPQGRAARQGHRPDRHPPLPSAPKKSPASTATTSRSSSSPNPRTTEPKPTPPADNALPACPCKSSHSSPREQNTTGRAGPPPEPTNTGSDSK